jgi:tetratricopeptide (TPR) repeat protein
MNPARVGWMGLGFVVLAVGLGRSWLDPDPSRLVTLAQADYQAGRYKAAEARLDQLGHLRPPTPMDRMARALVARALGTNPLAELAHIPDDHVLSSQAHLLAGQIEMDNGRLRAAETHLVAALARDASNTHAHRELAYIYNIQNRRRELDEQMDALSELGAVGFEHLVHWAKTRNGKWDSSRDYQSLTKYLAADPDDRDTRLALADGLQNLGQLEEAVTVLAPLADSDPEARARRALLALERGDTESADRLLSGGAARHPSLAKVRGLLALNRNHPGDAVHHLQIAYVAHPDDLAVVSSLARALRLVGDQAEAVRLLAAERRHTDLTPLIVRADSPMGPGDPKLPALLGAACEAAGRLAEARAWYRLAIVRDPLDGAAQQAVFRLAKIPADRSRVAHAVTAERTP